MENRYYSEFQELRTLGKGAFSTVFEVKNLKTDNTFAIKKIPFEEKDKENTLKEMQLLSKLNSDYVVEYIDSWIETNYYLNQSDSKLDSQNLLLNRTKILLLHIQTELCSMTLRQVINSLEVSSKNSMDTAKFSIANRLAVQIFECVDYLHSLKPAILHRDLKPENMMISKCAGNRCVKLADFGLSTYQKLVEESLTKYVGTESYRAPELNSSIYDTKADVYSLGRIMTELFNFDLNKDEYCVDNIIEANYCKAKDVCIKCLGIIPKNRPTCANVLDMKGLWAYNSLECDLFESIETLSKMKDICSTYSKMYEKEMLEAIKQFENEEEFEQMHIKHKQTATDEFHSHNSLKKNDLLKNTFLYHFNENIINSEKNLRQLLKQQIEKQKLEIEFVLNEIIVIYRKEMSKTFQNYCYITNDEIRQLHDKTVHSIIKHFANIRITQTKEKFDDLIKSTLDACYITDKKNSAAVLLSINYYETAIEKLSEKIQNLNKVDLIMQRIDIEKEVTIIFQRECVYGSEADRERFKHEFGHKLYEMKTKFKQKIDENERIVLEHTMNLIKTCVTHYDTLMTQYLEETLDIKLFKMFHEITLKAAVNMFTENCINKENRFIEMYRNNLIAKLETSFKKHLAKLRTNIKSIEKQYEKEVMYAINRYTKDMEKIMFDNQFIEDEEFLKLGKQVSDSVIIEFKNKEWQKTANYSDYMTELSKMISEECQRLFGINSKTREIAHNAANKYCKVVCEKNEDVMYEEIKQISVQDFDELHEKHKQSEINELKILNPFKCESLIDSYLSQIEKIIEKLVVDPKNCSINQFRALLIKGIKSVEQKYKSNIVNKEKYLDDFKSLLADYYNDDKLTLIKENNGNSFINKTNTTEKKEFDIEMESTFMSEKLLCDTKCEQKLSAEEIVIKCVDMYENELKLLVKTNKFSAESCENSSVNAKIFLEKNIRRIVNQKYLNKYFRKLNKKLKSITSNYETANRIVTVSRRKWRQKLENWNFMSCEDLLKFHSSLKQSFVKDIKKLGDNEVKSLIEDCMNEMLDENKKINCHNFDIQFESIVVKQTENIITSRIGEILKFGLFSKCEIKSIFNKLLNHLINTLNENLKVMSGLEIKDNHITKLRKTLEYNFVRIHLKRFYEPFEQTVFTLNIARNDSLKKYTAEMDLRVSSCVITDKNTLEDIHKNCQSIAFEYHNQQTRNIKTYFTPNVYHKLNATNKKSLTEDIKSKQQKYESNIISKKEQIFQYIAIYYGFKSLIAGHYSDDKITLIKYNTGNCVRDNSIAFCNGRVYFGYESDNEYKNNYKHKHFTHHFNTILELLNANIKTFTACELNQFCIKLKSDNRFTGDTSNNSLHIESLIALQLLTTKIDAEEQLQQCVANMVFTVPPYLSFREINVLRNSAKLAGFESQNYFLSEINALALNYIFGEKHVSPNETKLVFIIALNQTTYDAAICLVNHSFIKHVSYSYGNLSNTSQVSQAFQSQIYALTGGKETSRFNEALNIIENYDKEIKNVLICGQKIYKENVIRILSKKECSYPHILQCNDEDLINGAVIYSDILSNAINFNIFEIAKHSITIKFAFKVSSSQKYNLVNCGQLIENISKSYRVPNYKFPIDVYIFQKDVCVEHYYVPREQRKQPCLHIFDCHVRSNDRIEINYSIDNIFRKSMADFKRPIGNRDEMFVIEKLKFESFEIKLRKEKEDFKQSLIIRGMKKELNGLLEILTREIENSTDISRLKKKSCFITMDSALKTINCDTSKASDFEKQITTLNESLHSIRN